MTRRLLALFAPGMLAAQTTIVLNGDRIVSVEPRIPRPENGECPIPGCGWKAPKFHTATCPDGETCRLTKGMNISTSRRIDCEHCGCTFRQWADGKEPKR